MFIPLILPGGWFCKLDKERISIDKNDFSVDHGARYKIDAVLIGIHGTPGEDGSCRAKHDMLKLPYTSCDAATSALTFNKDIR